MVAKEIPVATAPPGCGPQDLWIVACSLHTAVGMLVAQRLAIGPVDQQQNGTLSVSSPMECQAAVCRLAPCEPWCLILAAGTKPYTGPELVIVADVIKLIERHAAFNSQLEVAIVIQIRSELNECCHSASI